MGPWFEPKRDHKQKAEQKVPLFDIKNNKEQYLFSDMARILAIDYGKKRTGLAVTDPEQIIATGLTTVETQKLLEFLDKYFQAEDVCTIVIGEAKHLNNTPSESAQYIEPFVQQLTKIYPNKQITRVDERFTSKIAFQTMIDGGLKKKGRQNKALIDTISATLILQTYMQQLVFAKTKS